MSNLFALSQIAVDITIPSDQDWIEGLGNSDPNTGAPIDLTGIALTLVVRRAVIDPLVIFTASTAAGTIQLLPATQGSTVNSVWAVVVYMVQDALSGRWRLPAALAPGSYVYGLAATDGVARRTIASGALTITQGVP